MNTEYKLKIAMLTAGDVFGGAERQLITLCKKGVPYFEPVIFQTLPGPLGVQCAKEGVSVNGALIGLNPLAQGARLARILQEQRFDLIHAHGYRGSVLAALAFIFGAHRPFVRTVHGAPEIASSYKMSLYGKLGDFANNLLSGHCVYVSRELLEKIGTGGAREHVIHNGIEPPVVSKTRPVEYAENTINMVIVGRLEPVKNVGAAIEAMTSLEVPENVHLHIIGDGPQRAELQHKVETLKLTARVHFQGFRPDVHELIAHADILLLPSLHEGVPYVLLEALALNVPVIASRVGGIPEVVAHLKEATLLDTTTAQTLASAIRELCLNEMLRKSLAAEGQRRVQESFSAESMARKYQQLYFSLQKIGRN